MEEESSLSRFLQNARASLALIREIALLMIIAMLIFNADLLTPVLKEMGLALEDAGFTELHIGGLKQDLTKLRENVEETGLNTQLAQEALENAKKILETTRGGDLTPSVAGRLKQAIAKISESQEQLGFAREQIEQVTSAALLPAGARTETTPPRQPPSADRWVVVIGADRTVASAKDEVRRAESEGFENAKILLRDDWYRTIIPFSTQEEADSALPAISAKIRRGSYMRNLDSWCKKIVPSESGDFKECLAK